MFFVQFKHILLHKNVEKDRKMCKKMINNVVFGTIFAVKLHEIASGGAVGSAFG